MNRAELSAAMARLSVVEAVNGIAALFFKHNHEVGWWTEPDGSHSQLNRYAFSNKLALIHSELSESLEGDRKPHPDKHLPHRDNREVELADAFIRLLDLAAAYNMDLGGAVVEKVLYNVDRADHKKEVRDRGGKGY